MTDLILKERDKKYKSKVTPIFSRTNHITAVFFKILYIKHYNIYCFSYFKKIINFYLISFKDFEEITTFAPPSSTYISQYGLLGVMAKYH